MAVLGRSGDRSAGRRVCAGAGRRAGGRRHFARLRARARHPHQPEESGHWRPRARREAGGRRQARPRDHRGAAARGRGGLRQSTFRATATPATDSHLELPIVEHPPDRLRAIEFAPFKAAIEASVAFIMTAHVLVPSIDDERPATLSPKIVQRILREELGFEGVIVSDDLEMKAIADTYSPGEAAVAAIAAGCDAAADVRNRQVGRHRAAGRGARSAHSRDRGRAPVGQTRRGRARAEPRGEGALPAPNGGRRPRPELQHVDRRGTNTAPSPTRWRSSPDRRC